MYMRTNCGLRTVVKILEIFHEVLEGKCGKVLCYNTVENWMKKLGLSVYENDRKLTDKKYAVVIDESIMINREKLLLLLGIPAECQGRALRHKDVIVISMKSGHSFTGDDIEQEIANSIKEIDQSPQYINSDQGHNLVNGIVKSGLPHHIDISHAMGTCLKHAYGNQADFVAFTSLLGKIRLQYHLTDKAYLFIPENKDLLQELQASVSTVRHVETICKTEGFSVDTCKKCQDYIVRHVIGNANNRRDMLGIKMREYFKKQEMLLDDAKQSHNISSDIIESSFGIYKDKKSQNKLFNDFLSL